MKCQGCGAETRFEINRIFWPNGKPEDAFYTCPICGKKIENADQGLFADLAKVLIQHKMIPLHREDTGEGG